MNQEKDTLSRIEEAQEALRESIETSKKLAADSDRLIRRHRRELASRRQDSAAG